VKKIKIATRNSPLAVWQAEYVKEELIKAHIDIEIELVSMQTEGDRFLESPLFNVGGKGLFIKELEEALLCNDADIAVHSMKDVVIDLPENLVLPVIMKREDSRDVMISNHYNQVDILPDHAVVGTSSLRRQSQLRRLCPNVMLKDLRGNVETRIRKLDNEEYDVILLAAAGMIRLGLSSRITQLVPHSLLLPAVGQGAIGIECRADDVVTQELIVPLNDEDTSLCVLTERAFSRRLHGGCQLPIAAHASIEGNKIKLDGLVAKLDGSEIIKSEKKGNFRDIESIGNSLAELLLERGADIILKELAN
jgi:hydroxymethylbilane synthase